MAVQYNPTDPTAGTPRATSPTEVERWVDYADTIADANTRMTALESATSQPRGQGIGIWAAVANTNWATAGGPEPTRISTGVVNASVSYDVRVAAGTYRFDMMHRAAGSRGIYTVEFSDDDGGSWSSPSSLGGAADTIDGYADSVAYTYSSITGIALTAGRWRIRLTMATKNASASAHYGELIALGLVRTGA